MLLLPNHETYSLTTSESELNLNHNTVSFRYILCHVITYKIEIITIINLKSRFLWTLKPLYENPYRNIWFTLGLCYFLFLLLVTDFETILSWNVTHMWYEISLVVILFRVSGWTLNRTVRHQCKYSNCLMTHFTCFSSCFSWLYFSWSVRQAMCKGSVVNTPQI